MVTAVRCPLCNNWMPVLTTKKGKPFLYCGKCRYGFMVLAKSGIEALNKVVTEVSESDLLPETRKKYNEKKAEG